MKLVRIVLSCLLFLVCAALASAEIYRWVDSAGVVHLTSAPPSAEVKATVVQMAQAAAQGEHRVQLYVTSWCPWCKKAINFFRSRGIKVTIYDIEQDSEAAQRKAQLDSRGGVPFAMIDGKPVHGYSEAAYLKALGREE